jgi:hypothetical protein
MSEWPKRYKCNILDGRIPVMMEDKDAQYVLLKDFDRLLDCFAKTLWHSNGKKTMPELKEMILNQIRNEGEKNG